MMDQPPISEFQLWLQCFKKESCMKEFSSKKNKTPKNTNVGKVVAANPRRKHRALNKKATEWNLILMGLTVFNNADVMT